MSDDSPPSHAYWSGYTPIDEPDEHRWRFEHRDHLSRPLTVDITFPEGCQARQRFRMVAAIKRAIDQLGEEDAPA